jgi:tRNA modification GTPase
MRSPQDTIAALATPPGESGIGVIRLSGPSALSITQNLFRGRHALDLASAPAQTCHVGSLVLDKPIDQVVVTLYRAPHSYTGDDLVEISAHGSPLILNRILKALVKQGARLADPGEFTQRAFLAGKLDLTQAEAVADLIRARTDDAHAAALAQLEGQLAAKVRALREQLLPLLAHVEVGLDHSDEDHDFLQREGMIAKCNAVEREIESLLQSSKLGKILREGLSVALVGRPNVGKSSLLNALLKEERAIVTPVPGTTRDTLEESVDWEGLPVILTDTAGVRLNANDPVERLGIERTRKALQSADLVLCVFDASEPLEPEDRLLISECMAKPHIWVINKADLPASWTPQQLASLNGGSASVSISAKTGTGLSDLVNIVKTVSLGGSAAPREARWTLNARHQAALETTRDALRKATQAAQQEAFEECVALELHAALQALGEIIGETATDDLLDQIFSTFCIGK